MKIPKIPNKLLLIIASAILIITGLIMIVGVYHYFPAIQVPSSVKKNIDVDLVNHVAETSRSGPIDGNIFTTLYLRTPYHYTIEEVRNIPPSTKLPNSIGNFDKALCITLKVNYHVTESIRTIFVAYYNSLTYFTYVAAKNDNEWDVWLDQDNYCRK